MPAGDPLADITGSLRQSYDPAHSGFGQEGRGKFAWAAPVALALHAGHRSGDLDLITMATATLDRMGWGGLSDDEAGAAAGAFHRATAQADWSEPDRAHLVEVQADMLRLYLDAWAITGDDRYRDRARAVWNYVDRVLHDRANGGFFVSELDGEVHRILLTDANAKMIRALLHASLAFEEVALAETAIRAAERLIPAVYERAGGVAHVLVDTRAQIQGLLGDQIHTVAALLDLADHTGDRVYFDLGDELLRGSLRKLWTAVPLIPPTGAVSGADPVPATEARARGGAFVDRLRSSAGAGDVGLLGEPLRPFALNVEAARLLDRLGRETGHADFIARAADLHIWLASEYRQHDLLAADYGLLLLAASP
jgi:uncharacterized protein YyaL (SSP411 family)